MSWAIVYLAGFGLGGRLPANITSDKTAAVSSWGRAVARTSAVLPIFLASGSGSLVLPVWLAVLSGGFVVGSLEAGSRKVRVTATAGRPDTVAVPHIWAGPALLRITSWPAVSYGDRWRSTARILDFLPHQTPVGLADPPEGPGVMLSGKGDPPEFGALIAGHLELSPPPGASLPGAFDYRMFLAGRGISWKGKLTNFETLTGTDLVTVGARKVFTPLRSGIVSLINRNLPESEAAMARAVLLGIRDQDSRQASRPFSDLGLAHLFAVSGLHVGILLGIFLLPAKMGGFSPWWKVGPLLILLPTYVLITGMPGSVVRAASLGFLALLAAALGKPSQPLRLIGLLFWAGTIWEPLQNLDVGLKLSYLAAGGILAVSSLTNGLKFSCHQPVNTLLTGLAVCGAAQWFTLPVIAGAFGRISLLSPVANLVAVPLFGVGVWCVVLSLLVGSIWPGGAESTAALGWLLFRSLAGLAGFISRASAGFPLGLPVPGIAPLFLWFVLTALAILVLYRHGMGKLSGRRACLLVFCAIGIGLMVFGPFSWKLRSPAKVIAWQFDVGQGDCSLVAFPDGWSVLIDTGGSFGFSGPAGDGPLHRNVLPFLRRNGMTDIDAVVLTHGHRDHIGGAAALAQALPVGRWYVSGRAGKALASVADSADIDHPKAGHILHRWRRWSLEVLYPPEEIPGHLHENDRSMVVVLRQGERDLAVWSGDMELAGEILFLDRTTVPRDIQVWKAGHHGSHTSGSVALLNKFDPALVMVSCGVGNTYGHPSHGPFVARGDTVPVARTDLQGSILLEWEPSGELRYRTMAPEGQKIRLP